MWFFAVKLSGWQAGMEKANGWFKQSIDFQGKYNGVKWGKETRGYFQDRTNEIQTIMKEADEKRNGG